MKKQIEIYTDGACRGNPGPGGWGALLRYQGREKSISGAETLTTNNQMELKAAVEALTCLKESCEVDLTTDSRYVQQGITQWMAGWKKKGWKNSQKAPVKNLPLWQALDELTQKHTVRWHWVKGHSGHKENEWADHLANEAIDHLLANKGSK